MRFRLVAVVGIVCFVAGQASGQSGRPVGGRASDQEKDSSGAQASAQDSAPFKTPLEQLSYAMGMDLGNSMRKQDVNIDATIFAQGLKDAVTGGKTLLTEEQVRATIFQLQTSMRDRLLAKNKKDGATFLAENKAKEGVITLLSGLQYKILKAGDGNKPKLTDTVVCHYRGTLVDGTEFDNSYKRKQPATFPVDGVIKGWTEALQLMPVGSTWQLFAPSDLAYPDGRPGTVITPGSALIFEVELISIK